MEFILLIWWFKQTRKRSKKNNNFYRQYVITFGSVLKFASKMLEFR